MPGWTGTKGFDEKVPLATFVPILAKPMSAFVSPPLNYQLLAGCDEQNYVVALGDALQKTT